MVYGSWYPRSIDMIFRSAWLVYLPLYVFMAYNFERQLVPCAGLTSWTRSRSMASTRFQSTLMSLTWGFVCRNSMKWYHSPWSLKLYFELLFSWGINLGAEYLMADWSLGRHYAWPVSLQKNIQVKRGSYSYVSKRNKRFHFWTQRFHSFFCS